MTPAITLFAVLCCILIAQLELTRRCRQRINRRNDNARMLRAINRSHGGHIK